jgi:hypothetical protein
MEIDTQALTSCETAADVSVCFSIPKAQQS